MPEEQTPADVANVPEAGETKENVKVKNLPLSASNALQPEAGIQIPSAGDTKEVLVTDPYDPSKTKSQIVETGDNKNTGKVTKAKFDQLASAFQEVLDNHVMDISHQMIYKAKAGI